MRGRLEDDGLIDYVNVSMGGYLAFTKMIGAMHEPHGYEIATSEPATRPSKVPTIVTGRILTMAEAEQVIASGAADIVSFVRALLADPDLVQEERRGARGRGAARASAATRAASAAGSRSARPSARPVAPSTPTLASSCEAPPLEPSRPAAEGDGRRRRPGGPRGSAYRRAPRPHA